jgi:hypothetical protein
MMSASVSASKFSKAFFAAAFVCFLAPLCGAQVQAQSPAAASVEEAGTSTDLFIMLGSDFVRPGLVPKANDNIGIGHTFGFLKKDPIGDELTFAYTYEDAGSGFWHSDYGSHTESFGAMKNFGLPKTTRVSGYTWVQIGISTFTGNAQVQNHFYDGESLGAVVHFTEHSSILDSGNVQQNHHGSLVYDDKYWLHEKLVSGNSRVILSGVSPRRIS